MVVNSFSKAFIRNKLHFDNLKRTFFKYKNIELFNILSTKKRLKEDEKKNLKKVTFKKMHRRHSGFNNQLCNNRITRHVISRIWTIKEDICRRHKHGVIKAYIVVTVYIELLIGIMCPMGEGL